MPASGVIFSGNTIKALKPALKLYDQATIKSGSADPSSSATEGTIGDIFLRTGTPDLFQKHTSTGTDTNWRKFGVTSSGDIGETSFSAANNQAAPANVTGLAFSNASIRSFESLVSVFIDATSDLYEVFTLRGIQRGADWQMSATSTGDVSSIVFSITTAGQVQYTSANYTGFVSGTIKFRAITVSV